VKRRPDRRLITGRLQKYNATFRSLSSGISTEMLITGVIRERFNTAFERREQFRKKWRKY